jgi:hypothetical protein
MPILTDQARKAIIAISVFAVACVVVLLGWALVAVMSGEIVGEQFPGKLLLLLVGGSKDIFGRSLAGLLLLISYGATAVAGSKVKDGLYYAIVALSGLGILATIGLLILMNDNQLAAHVARASDVFNTVSEYRGAQNVFLGAVLVWLVGTLATQLGIELKAQHEGQE